MGPTNPAGNGTRPPARHLQDVLDGLTNAQLTERLQGFRHLLDTLPADDDVMRPLVEAMADAVASELQARPGQGKRLP
jgi:hypothetical protein